MYIYIPIHIYASILILNATQSLEPQNALHGLVNLKPFPRQQQPNDSSESVWHRIIKIIV